MLLEKGNVILLTFTWLCRTATFSRLGCIYSLLMEPAYALWRKWCRKNAVYLCGTHL